MSLNENNNIDDDTETSYGWIFPSLVVSTDFCYGMPPKIHQKRKKRKTVNYFDRYSGSLSLDLDKVFTLCRDCREKAGLHLIPMGSVRSQQETDELPEIE